MSFFEKAKAAAEQAATKAKEEYGELQLKRELSSAYNELGKTAFQLIEEGEIEHDKLEEPAAKVRSLREKLEAVASPEPAAEPETPADPELAADEPEPPAATDEPGG